MQSISTSDPSGNDGRANGRFPVRRGAGQLQRSPHSDRGRSSSGPACRGSHSTRRLRRRERDSPTESNRLAERTRSWCPSSGGQTDSRAVFVSDREGSDGMRVFGSPSNQWCCRQFESTVRHHRSQEIPKKLAIQFKAGGRIVDQQLRLSTFMRQRRRHRAEWCKFSQRIRIGQELLGHVDVGETLIYTHALNRRCIGARSPAERL
jgi:hypothetical protein